MIREACAAEGGVEVDTQGDAFFVAFPTAPGALAAAAALTESLAPGPIHARVGLHTGTPLMTDEGYVGDDVHRAALVGSDNLVDLGEHRFKDLPAGRLWGAIEREQTARPLRQWDERREEYETLVGGMEGAAFASARAEGRLLSIAEAADAESAPAS